MYDRNNNKIYENDILQNEDGELAIVEWSKTDAMFILLIDNVETNFSNENAKWWVVQNV